MSADRRASCVRYLIMPRLSAALRSSCCATFRLMGLPKRGAGAGAAVVQKHWRGNKQGQTCLILPSSVPPGPCGRLLCHRSLCAHGTPQPVPEPQTVPIGRRRRRCRRSAPYSKPRSLRMRTGSCCDKWAEQRGEGEGD